MRKVLPPDRTNLIFAVAIVNFFDASRELASTLSKRFILVFERAGVLMYTRLKNVRLIVAAAALNENPDGLQSADEFRPQCANAPYPSRNLIIRATVLLPDGTSFFIRRR